jgi:DNA processing protein
MENFEEKACLCALNRIFGFEPKIGLALISHLGSASEVFRLSSEAINSLIGPYSKYRDRINASAFDQASNELKQLENQGIHFCGITENHYPSMLKECEDPPIGLYVRSSTPVQELWKDNSIGIVGTRDISPYGKEWCQKIVKNLSMTGHRPPIISGLALGVDIAAHRTAIENGLPTIAVMATGPESIYPYRHRADAERIINSPGCALITDYPPGTAPLAIHFLRRNRIIAGLSRSVLLIESRIKGGGLMTCRLAFSYNRDIYALPGRADDIRSEGCNELIRKKIAEPITSIITLTESLGMKVRRTSAPSIRQRLEHTYKGRIPDEDLDLMCSILMEIKRNRGITADELSDNIGIGFIKTMELTGMLEIDGIISIDLLRRCSINLKFM